MANIAPQKTKNIQEKIAQAKLYYDGVANDLDKLTFITEIISFLRKHYDHFHEVMTIIDEEFDRKDLIIMSLIGNQVPSTHTANEIAKNVSLWEWNKDTLIKALEKCNFSDKLIVATLQYMLHPQREVVEILAWCRWEAQRILLAMQHTTENSHLLIHDISNLFKMKDEGIVKTLEESEWGNKQIIEVLLENDWSTKRIITALKRAGWNSARIISIIENLDKYVPLTDKVIIKSLTEAWTYDTMVRNLINSDWEKQRIFKAMLDAGTPHDSIIEAFRRNGIRDIQIHLTVQHLKLQDSIKIFPRTITNSDARKLLGIQNT